MMDFLQIVIVIICSIPALIFMFWVIKKTLNFIFWVITSIVTSVKLNCVLSIVIDSVIIVYLCTQLYKQNNKYIFIFVAVYILSIADCIRDLIKENRYNFLSKRVPSDGHYITKGILTIITLGMARAVFLIVTIPWLLFFEIKKILTRICSVIKSAVTYIWVSIKIRSKLQNEKIVSSFFEDKALYKFYTQIDKAIENGLSKGTILRNQSTVNENLNKYMDRNNKNSPKNFFEKAIESVTKDGQQKRKIRQDNNTQINLERFSSVYIQRSYFMECKKRFPNFLKAFGFLSIEDLIDKLESGGQIQEISQKPKAQIKFFVIFVLDTLCEEGIVETQDVNDEKYNDIKQYCVVGGKQMESVEIDDLLV